MRRRRMRALRTWKSASCPRSPGIGMSASGVSTELTLKVRPSIVMFSSATRVNAPRLANTYANGRRRAVITLRSTAPSTKVRWVLLRSRTMSEMSNVAAQVTVTVACASIACCSATAFSVPVAVGRKPGTPQYGGM